MNPHDRKLADMAITYKTDTDGVDWALMRQTLIDDDFDNFRTPKQYQLSFENSAAVVIAYDGDAIVGTARMLSDGVCNAYIVDVWTHSRLRNQGIARTMMQMLESKAQGQHVSLWTSSTPEFYERIGYRRSHDGILFEKVVGEWLQNDTR